MTFINTSAVRHWYFPCQHTHNSSRCELWLVCHLRSPTIFKAYLGRSWFIKFLERSAFANIKCSEKRKSTYRAYIVTFVWFSVWMIWGNLSFTNVYVLILSNQNRSTNLARCKQSALFKNGWKHYSGWQPINLQNIWQWSEKETWY